MRKKSKHIILIGSARYPRSTSRAIGEYLTDKLKENGDETEIILLHKAMKNEETVNLLITAVKEANTLAIIYPLYVDSLPYLVIKAMELIKKKKLVNDEKRLLCIVNSGFPEIDHSKTATEICRKFSKETGFGGFDSLILGGGAALDGKPLNKIKGMARNIIKSLDIVAENLINNEKISDKAIKYMSKPIVPKRLYLFFGNHSWKKIAKKYGKENNLYDKPYSTQ